MRTLEPYIEADKENFKRKNHELWLSGLYSYKAFGAVVSQMFKGKETYFKEPIDFENAHEEEREFTEEEKLELQKKVLLQLQVMELNYKHGNKEDKEER